MEPARAASLGRDGLDDLSEVVGELPVAVYVCEAPDGRIRFFNRRAAELWGREPALGTPDEAFCGSLRLFRTDGRPLLHAETPMAETLRDGARRSGEVVIEREDGSRVTVSVAIAPLRDAGGALVGVVNAFQDVSERKRVEEALRSSEARYRAIVENQSDLVCRFRPDGTMTFANAAYCAYFGVAREQILGRPYAPVVPAEDQPAVAAQVAALSPENPTVVIENRVRRGDGALRWTQWTNHALYDTEGRLVEVQATGRDTTEQRQAHLDSVRLAAIVANADDAIVSKTIDGTITSWNRAAERMFGHSASEAVGQSIHLIVPPDREEEERDVLRRLARGETIEHFETLRRKKDGTVFPVSISVSPLRDARGRVVGASKIARDISERRLAEQRLQRTVETLEVLYRLVDVIGHAPGREAVCEAGLEALLTIAGAGRASVLVRDGAGVMRFVSWRGLSERYRQAVDGHSPWPPGTARPEPILVEDMREDPRVAAYREVFEAEGIRSLAFLPLEHQGRLLGKFMAYYDAPHVFTPEELRLEATIAQHVGMGLARVAADEAIAELLRRERAARVEADRARSEAEAANRAKDEFLAMLAHELRNPLGVVVNAAAILDQDGVTGGSRRAVDMIRRQSGHLARLLDDLLDVARISSGRIELEKERVDLSGAVAHALEAQRHAVEAKRQRLGVFLHEGAVEVIGDPVRLQQVLGNLVNNASKYTPAGGAIDVSLAAEEGQAVLRVRDDGSGIPKDKLEEVFGLFVQANPSLARTEGGLGIGLTLVKRIVDLHGGTVRAHSEGPGRGAEFVVRLPLAPGVPRPAALTSPAPALPKPQRILVIEDHQDGREALVATLERYGHEVLEAGTGEKGLDLAGRHRPTIVLVDIGLPDIEGYEVGRELRRTLGDGVRLVALTGYGQPRDRALAVEAGFDAHLVKPVDPPQLAETLARLG